MILLKKFIEWVFNGFRRSLLFFSLLALIINFIVEVLSRRSFGKAFRYMIRNPYTFLMGTLIVLFSLTLCFFFRKRAFAVTVASSFWLISGIVNFNVVGYRITPVSVMDVIKVPSVITIAPVYYAIWQIVLTGLAIIVFLVLMDLFRRRCHKYPVKAQLKNTFLALLTIALLFTVLNITGLNYDILQKNRGRVVEHYENNGFVYSFSKSAFFWGVEAPEDFSLTTAEDIIKYLNKEEYTDEETRPNLIFVQLESFFDVDRLRTVNFSKDPIPEFHRLEKQGISGALHVPVVGAGTINTEFEVLTGMSMEYFGLGELPFETVLEERTTDTIAYHLSGKDYTSHFIHNSEGDFYQRDMVYSHLGFDTFTSVEFMQDVEYNICGTWPKDTILTRYIMDAMESTKDQDLIMAVTVQSHGKYPPNDIPEDYVPEIDAAFNDATAEEGISSIDAVRYYVNEIYEVDQFIRELKETIDSWPEKTVLVLYGDHLPSLSISPEDLNEGTSMETEYVIVSNYGLEDRVKKTSAYREAESHDLYAYQLYAEVLGLCGLHDGALTKLHQSVRTLPQYKQWLNVLEYAILGAEQEGETEKSHSPVVSEWEPKTLKFGVEPIKIISTSYLNGELVISGAGFTPYSKVLLDDRVYNDTEFMNDRVIRLKVDQKEIGKRHELSIAQVSTRGKILDTFEHIQWSD